MKNLTNDKGSSGMVGFSIIWAGQLISILGSAMSNFAIMIWLWKTTGQATPFAIFGFSVTVPLIIASPLAGALVDRWDRKLTMAISDLAAGASTIIMLILFSMGSLEVWHLYLLGASAGFFGAFQFPAFSAAITMMVSKENYARASGMRSLAGTVSGIFAPILAATLLEIIGIKGILIIDIITFSIAVGTLFFVYIPKPPVTKEGLESMGSLWKESLYGFKYLYQKKSLFGLLGVFLVMNMALSFSSVLQTPMVLARTGNNQWILGGVNSASTIGGLISGILLMAWGGPKKKIRGLFAAMMAMGIGVLFMGCGEGLVIWASAGFCITFFAVIANASSQAFWQTKVAPDVQGKVFAARSMISRIASPISMILAGPLADKVFEPGMTGGSDLARLFGWLVGTESGSGISFMFLITGVIAITTAIVGYMIQSIRDADKILPDHEVGVN